MKFDDDDYRYRKEKIKFPTIVLLASLAVLFILSVVYLTNGKKGNKTSSPIVKPQQNIQTETQSVEEGEKLTASDLDFWDMYENKSVNDLPQYTEVDGRDDNTSETDPTEDDETNVPEQENPEEEKDDKHVTVMHHDGTVEKIPVNSSIKLNTFDDFSFQSQNGIIGYYQNNHRTTKTGADISQYTSSIDWKILPNEVDYLMIRVGARGYDSGNIIADTKFIDNVISATKAGIPFGLYFSSQAINEEEAKAEVQYIQAQISAAQAAINTLNTASITTTASNNTTTTTQTQNQTSPQTTTTQTGTSTSGNNAFTVHDLSRGVPTINVTVAQSVSDSEGNTTTIYVDSTAVTKYQNGDITTAYSNGFYVTNTPSGNVVKKDGSGNTLSIDSAGYYTITDSNGNVKETGQSNDMSSTTTTQAGITNNTNNTNNNNSTNNNSANSNTNQTSNNQPLVTYTFKLTYPIAMDMHLIANDTSRLEGISVANRTVVAQTFMNEIKAAGYTPMLMGNKEMLLSLLNLQALGGYDIWLNNEASLPEYPYQLMMWKYNSSSNLIQSLKGEYGVDTCFVDYEIR